MITTPIPTTIDQLLQTVTQATGNIAKHRAAMAEVAAQAKAAQPEPPRAGGETK